MKNEHTHTSPFFDGEHNQDRVWADGHAILRCGPSSGHTTRPIAYVEDSTMAQYVAAAINAFRAKSELLAALMEVEKLADGYSASKISMSVIARKARAAINKATKE